MPHVEKKLSLNKSEKSDWARSDGVTHGCSRFVKGIADFFYVLSIAGFISLFAGFAMATSNHQSPIGMSHIANYRKALRNRRLSIDTQAASKHLRIGEIFRSLAMKQLHAVALAKGDRA